MINKFSRSYSILYREYKKLNIVLLVLMVLKKNI